MILDHWNRRNKGTIPVRHDATLAIRADLLRRVDALAAQRGHLSVPRIHDEIDQIRHIARGFRFDAVEELAGALQSELSVHGHGPTILSYLDLIRAAAEVDVVPAVPLTMALPVQFPSVQLPPAHAPRA